MSEREFILQLSEDQVAALVETMFLAAESDGEVAAVEVAELAQSIDRVTSGQVGQERASALIDQARTALEQTDRATRLAAVRDRLTEGQRRHALLLAIQVAFSDGTIRTSERELILETAEALGIDGDTAADLVNAVTQSGS